MKINNIRIQHIGAHKDTEVDLIGKPSIIAITGENGAGKTFLLEAVPACLYGAFPTRPGSLYDRITNGFEGEACIEISFEMDGASYKATRILKRTGKTTTSEAHLMNLDAPMKIAGPKVTDFENAIVNLLGPQDTFLASVFSSQKNTGDVCDARPAERKAVFAKLLGLEKYDRLSVAAKEKAKGIDVQIESQYHNVKELKQRGSGIDRARNELTTVEMDIKDQTQKLGAEKAIVKSLEDKVSAGAVALERWSGLDRQLKQSKEAIAVAEENLKTMRQQFASIKEQAAKAGDLDKTEKELEEAEAERERLQQLRQEQEKLWSDINMEEIKLGRAKSEVAQLRASAALIDQTPAQECCKGCPLVASAYNAKEALQGAQDRFNEVNTAHEALKSKVVGIDVDGTRKQLTEITMSVATIKRALEAGKSAREAQGQLKAMEEQGKKEKANLEAKRVDLDKLEVEVKIALGQCPDPAIAQDLGIEKQKQDQIERMIMQMTTNLGAIKQVITGMEEDLQKAEAIEKSMAGIFKQSQDLKEIERAFGRSGIQPLIIEQARPELEEIANEMLGAATEGKMSVRFATTKELKSGETAESLDIIISRDGTEQEIGEFSGGEQKLIRTAIRLTLAVWQARRGGSRLRTLFIDEVFDALDKDNSERVLKLMQSLQGQFDRILLISHDDDLLEELPDRINLRKGENKC